ncbi:PAAR domain-containing protein [Aureibacter tunicatorum]|uniref:Zn-binding protein involved in type VI secretion n=1 Tax=Aureibacter tunicatorum TaxID=866807 RepID=A0AAE4BV97_9BACT|nr:PAAR domain-containing protein [Aureibacter tunicatorum]MDR6241662.1 putative Zn-binding protein involved in type VI secretion [Aureibacter tunicatorum]BDD07352.1 type VI secretion protein [Aureibacter tunicatorum]
MPPAARLTDMHACPNVEIIVPHVGGPIVGPGCPTVLIEKLPAATLGNQIVCVGQPDSILLGSFTVFIQNQPACRLGDPSSHGGSLVLGSFTVFIG